MQSYLFAVPRLRTMLGANALLGETLRGELTKHATTSGCCAPAGWDSKTAFNRFAVDNEDPLGQVSGLGQLADDPRGLYEKGVLARDGGHFQALFGGEGAVKLFVEAASKTIGSQLSGLMFDIAVTEWEHRSGWLERTDLSQTAAATQPLFMPAEFAVCQLSGQGLATERIKIAKGKSRLLVSKASRDQWEAGTRFSRRAASDIVSLMQRARIGGEYAWPCMKMRRPDDLQALAGGPGHYIALVHADGNSVGGRSTEYRGNAENATIADWLVAEAKGELFFYGMRVAVRKALTKALNSTFGSYQGSVRPYQVLMLGGDDLLMACQASYALDFVRNYAQALTQFDLPDSQPLGIGAGVAICQSSMPIHVMHALAEDLASSAKRLARASAQTSVVDWMVVTNATTMDLAQHRKQHDVVRYQVSSHDETLVLSQKPYRVLAASGEEPESVPSLNSLTKLMDAASGLRKPGIARSQLKALPQALRRGLRAGKFAFEDVPDKTRCAIEQTGVGTNPWTRPDKANSPHLWMTAVPDLVEVVEIPRLGRRNRA